MVGKVEQELASTQNNELEGGWEGGGEGDTHPCLGGLDVKACFLHSWLGWRARQSHLVIHVCVIHITCTRHMSVRPSYTSPATLCM